jgi:glutamate-5-semialdehyde dehydrogenase
MNVLSKDLARDLTALEAEMLAIGRAARDAAAALREASTEQKNKALTAAARAIRADEAKIIAANDMDMKTAVERNLTPALLDRLKLDSKRLEATAKGVADVASLPDPVGRELARWKRPNGLDIARIATPIGVIGIIYESRPNVTADAGALCLKAGNVSILRGGSESLHSSRAIHAALVKGLEAAGLPTAAIQLVPTTDRAAVGYMLTGLAGAIDMIVPRGGKSLVARVQTEARVPVLAHLEGICHTYVHEKADLAMARKIVLNAKMRRTGICGATETLLIDRAIFPTHLVPILDDLAAAGCEIRGDADVQRFYAGAKPATEEDWRTEYLDAIIAVRAVEGVEEAIRHIATYGSQHTESIVTEDSQAAERFLSGLDSAIVMHNASTQFADGGEFGMGAEIGIGTGKLHARGPVGVEQLTIFKYVVRGTGQTRP